MRWRVWLMLALLAPAPVSAHAFGQRYDLPIPLRYFLIGAGTVLVYTFFSLAFTLTSAQPARERSLGRPPRLLQVLGVVSAASLLAITSLAATFGSPNPVKNFSSTFFWVITWIGLPYAALVLGNFWEHLNPLVPVARLAERRLKTLPYPARWGYFPAVVAMAGFIVLELVIEHGYFPRYIAAALTVYVGSLVMGCVVYGRAWLRHAEFFTVLSRLLGGISPVGWRGGRLHLRPPGAGLLTEPTATPGLVPFIILFIAGVTYDGFRDTTIWARIFTANDLPISTTILGVTELVGTLLLLLGVYYLTLAVVRRAARVTETVQALANRFSLALVPVAAAYTVAHYFSYFLVTGQEVIRLASDPFGRGWDLFGTAGFQPDIGLIPLKTIWYLQVAIVLVGHALGLYVSHRVALRSFRNGAVRRSQYPLLILIIALTSLALWILHAPLGK